MSTEQDEVKPGIFNQDIVQQRAIAKVTASSLKRLSEAKDNDVRGIASSQIEMLSEFYKLSLSQASRSFRWALIASVVGLLFLMAAIVFQFQMGTEMATVALIGGGLIEFIAGVNFYLYGKTLSQLNLYQGRLEQTQRFLVANSLCESLGDDLKDKTRAHLITQLASHDNSDYGHPSCPC